MDFTSPSAFWAFAIVVLASCASAVPHIHANPIATHVSFFTTATPPSYGMRIVLAEARRATGLPPLTEIWPIHPSADTKSVCRPYCPLSSRVETIHVNVAGVGSAGPDFEIARTVNV